MVSALLRMGEPKVSDPSKRNRFPRAARLLRHADFERAYKQGRRHFTAHMTVFYRQRDEGSGLRVGFTVGRVLGGAVQRNRIKRRLREAVRLNWPEGHVAADMVIHPKKSVLQVDFSELQEEISRAFAVVQKAVSAKSS
jgi:ribonuclease P protein component